MGLERKKLIALMVFIGGLESLAAFWAIGFFELGFVDGDAE